MAVTPGLGALMAHLQCVVLTEFTLAGHFREYEDHPLDSDENADGYGCYGDHPDEEQGVVFGEGAHDRLLSVNTAYEVLSDLVKPHTLPDGKDQQFSKQEEESD